ncbi:hypothetical protein [Prauserella cavernicola]|uniref:Uncharacterized protein n=1 Tax=Prauserella cavernicola TaxID=2800127 RepID=A0A934QXK6_9PSEU|nr:hypothetical protein [Prauserella cavernicola]MBK1787139.1 hypothetical protein [Prauserella cavernicola]
MPGSLVIEIVGVAGRPSMTEGDAVGVREPRAGCQSEDCCEHRRRETDGSGSDRHEVFPVSARE